MHSVPNDDKEAWFRNFSCRKFPEVIFRRLPSRKISAHKVSGVYSRIYHFVRKILAIMFAFQIALTAIISLLSPSLALMPLEVVRFPTTLSASFTSSNATAAHSCPTVTSTVRAHECFKNVQVCPDPGTVRTTTVPCGCPASAAATTVTACPGCGGVRWMTVTAGGC
ncbi:hypothetical protein HO173_006285 [Letharia columbiana]|uniref:Transmembrane protein n=1 Tax=Letharia columbiana TaxID=112416 RepID=A0A8H6FVJ9_9LECA|nr:uncharacterized protein HO173_006285 [Letharia columbiana]KAF6235602.1 hypothetical protein HO173_006285 [Letharia columbiana]